MSRSDAPRILLIVERFVPDLGGVARSATRTAHALSRVGAEVHVLAWTKTLPAGVLQSETHEQDNSEVMVHRLGLFSNWDLSLQHTSNVLRWLRARRSFQLAWGHYVFPAGFAAVCFAESNGLPSVVSARGNDIDRLMFPPGDFARLMWTLQRATSVTAVSHDLAQKIDMLLGDAGRAEVMHNVVDTEVFAPRDPAPALRETLGIDPQEAVLGFCGELRHKKGLPFLLAALQQVRQRRPACLLVIGAVRPREQAQLTAYAAEFPDDAERIKITGHLDEPAAVADHLTLCDVVLLPSVWDGLPNALLESMAAGRLVLASDAGGIPEAVEHCIDGFLIEVPRLDRLAEAVLEILDQPVALRTSVQAAARSRIEQNFTHAHEESRLRALLKKLGIGG